MAEPVLGAVLRRIGRWEERGYTYPDPGLEPIATKTFTWTCVARAKHVAMPVTLSYFSNVTVEPRRLNDLAYLAAEEAKALAVLEAMVLEATHGWGFIPVPNPGLDIKRAVLGLVGAWVEQRAHPETWPLELSQVIDEAVGRALQMQLLLRQVGAHVHPPQQGWGMRFEIEPVTPEEGGGG